MKEERKTKCYTGKERKKYGKGRDKLTVKSKQRKAKQSKAKQTRDKNSKGGCKTKRGETKQ